MKKNLLWTLLIIGITASAFGVYYLDKTNSSLRYNQSPENEFSETAGTIEKKDPDRPDKGKLWRALAWKDENGRMPPNAISEAVRKRDERLKKQKPKEITSEESAGSNQESSEPLGVAGMNWVSRGPQNVGGRTRSIIVHPNNPNIIWAGSVGGGVWKSTDGGTTWLAANGNLQNFAISSMAIDPNNPNILYAGTGEGFFNIDALQGGGIFRTTDGGMTWTQLPETKEWYSVDRISIAHNNSSLILAGTSGGIRRSENGGATWSIPFPADKSFYVAFDPTNNSKAIAEVKVGENHKVVYSTDSGLSWANATRDSGIFLLTGWLERIELAYSRSNPNIVYALFPSAGGGTIARSTDGGQNFTTRATQGGGIQADWYKNTLWVSPSNPDFIVTGGYNHYKSTNGGDNFTQISDGYILSVQPHVDQHCIVSDPGYDGITNKRVYVCGDGGVYRTNDITTVNKFGDGGGWERKDFTYQTTQYYGAAGNGTTGLIYGGTQDNATLRLLPNSQNANLLYGGDGGFSAVDPTDDNYCYGEHIYLELHRSTDRGASAHSIFGGIADAQNSEKANFIAPFILDPNDRNRMLAGGHSLWQTNNVRAAGQPTWTSIRPGGSHKLSAIAIAPGNPNVIWIAQNDGKVYKTNTGLDTIPTWITIDDNGGANPLPDRFPTRILIDKDNSNIVYIAFGGFTDGNLQKTIDGGATIWQNITGVGLDDVPIRGIARHPNNSNKLYVATEIGVYSSDNGGTTWDAVLDGPANVSVDELVFMSNSTTLLAATHGRGIWTTNIEEVPGTRRASFDFDGDGRSDVSVFRPTAETWFLDRSTAGFQAVVWGASTDKKVAADYDGDGKADVTVWRPSNGGWYRINSSDGAQYSVQFGDQGDVPVPADYDNDGKTDEAVFRPSNGTWYLLRSSLGFTAVAFGQNGEIPVPADYDGDRIADIAVFRPSNGTWYLQRSSLGFTAISFGQAGDKPVAADYDGDSKADVAVFRSGTWYLNRSSLGFSAVPWGESTDTLVPADYDGDGKADIAVWRPADGTWHLRQSANGYRSVQFGANGDVPIPAIP